MKISRRILAAFLLIVLLCYVSESVSYAEDVSESDFIEMTPQYSNLGPFSGNLAIAKSDNKYSIIDFYGNEYYATNSIITSFNNSIITTVDENNQTSSGVDCFGKVYFSKEAAYLGECVNGKIAFTSTDDLMGLINENGAVMIEAVYKDIVYSQNNNVFVLDDSGWSLINIDNQAVLVSGMEDIILSSTKNSVFFKKDGLYGLMNFEGTELLHNEYCTILDNCDGTFCCYTEDQVILAEESGAVLFSSDADYLSNCNDDYVVTVKDSEVKCLNINNNSSLDLEMDDKVLFAEPFYEDYAVITMTDGYQTYINKNGELATDLMWDRAFHFANGYALVVNNEYDAVTEKEESFWYIINNNFEIVQVLSDKVYLDRQIDTSADFSDGYIRTIDSQSGKMGFIVLKEFMKNDDLRISLSIANIRANVGDTIDIPVALSEKSDAYGGNFTLQYDNSVLSLVSAEKGDAVSGYTAYVNPDYQSAGNKVRFTFSGTEPLSSGGTLCVLKFKVLETDTKSTTIEFVDSKLYDSNSEPIDKKIINGVIKIVAGNNGELTVSRAEVTTAGVEVELTNNSDYSEARAVIAYYQDGKMLASYLEDISLAESEHTFTTSCSAAYDTCKLFILDQNTLRPICNSTIVTDADI